LTSPKNQVDIIHCDDITVEEFIEKYEKASKPLIIKVSIFCLSILSTYLYSPPLLLLLLLLLLFLLLSSIFFLLMRVLQRNGKDTINGLKKFS
jgi:hypothetical protein